MARGLRRIRGKLWLGAGVFAVLLLVAFGEITRDARAQGGTLSSTVFATVIINTLGVSISAPTSVAVGDRFELMATVGNVGFTAIRKGKATIQLPALPPESAGGTVPTLPSDPDVPPVPAFSFNGKGEKNMGTIPPAKEKDVRWRLTAEAEGCYLIQVTATGTEDVSGAALEEQATAMVEVGTGACSVVSASGWAR